MCTSIGSLGWPVPPSPRTAQLAQWGLLTGNQGYLPQLRLCYLKLCRGLHGAIPSRSRSLVGDHRLALLLLLEARHPLKKMMLPSPLHLKMCSSHLRLHELTMSSRVELEANAAVVAKGDCDELQRRIHRRDGPVILAVLPVSAGIGLTTCATSAPAGPGLGSPRALTYLHRDWAHPCPRLLGD
jgi:hypothetical protein